MTITKKIMIASALGLLSTAAFAQTPSDNRTDEVNARIAHQDQRIEQGEQSGQLTPKEATHLENRETKVGADAAKAEADGKVTKPEARKLNREENRDSKRIYRQKHDAQTAPGAATGTAQ